ncbi:hypothetical protein ALTERO38_40016 [Alteromonas sp. 38]|nr:hypothetical protein ALTER154_90235 [Alteromonas sp. 154]VXB15346.1 hypothetical protein ALTERO38_40016 [Alteromonas sp. 38]
MSPGFVIEIFLNQDHGTNRLVDTKKIKAEQIPMKLIKELSIPIHLRKFKSINIPKEPKDKITIFFLFPTMLLLILCHSFGVILRQLTLS